MQVEHKLTFGSLFSGIGGLDLGLEHAGMVCKWQVEIDPWCQRVLWKHWPDVPKYSDIKELSAEELEPVALIAGGFPCQPFSHAGRRSAEGDDRYLWPQMLRIIRAVRPRFVVAENVYGLVTSKQGLVLETVYLDLEDAGYEVAPAVVFPAAALGAPHRRDRVWICAYSRHDGRSTESQLEQAQRAEVADRVRAAFADADDERCDGEVPASASRNAGASPQGRDWWEVEPGMGRMVHGIPRRVDRLRGLGNAVVPQVAQFIGECISATAG